MQLSDFDYALPKSCIAQQPLDERDRSKLMALDRADGSVRHHVFSELPELLDPDSVLVLNQSRVLPARLLFTMGKGQAEILLVKPVPSAHDTWECLVRPGNKFRAGAEGQISPECAFLVEAVTPDGLRVIRFRCGDFRAFLRAAGLAPTPPYIKAILKDPERYQTVYAKTEGSAAAPTAGLHFTERVFEGLKKKGIGIEFVTLHVGLGTFAPVKTEQITAHKLHSEWFELDAVTAARLNAAKKAGKKIVAVGTTSVRVLESCADESGELSPKTGETDIFITSGYQWKFVDQLITNFHVPKSSLLMLVSAFAHREHPRGRDVILRAYEQAQKAGYRFFSFGDAMWIR